MVVFILMMLRFQFSVGDEKLVVYFECLSNRKKKRNKEFNFKYLRRECPVPNVKFLNNFVCSLRHPLP